MAVADSSIGPKILASAKREFLANGFEKTSLKAICDGAGITTGALYKRYKSKEELFGALVAPTVADMDAVVEQRSAVSAESMADGVLLKAWDMDREDMLWWFRFLYERHDGFVLLLRCAEGTQYAHFQHDWVAKMTRTTGAFLAEAQRRGLTRTDVSQKELHILLAAFWETIYEPFIHDFSWQEIETHCAVVCSLFNWQKALAFRVPG